jgi:AcrR family transcriptional regulator
MARDAELTRRRAREAALAEFAAHGLHGTTMERIAARAGVNKERVYHYYGDKRALFATVVGDQLAAVVDAVPLVLREPGDLGRWAGRVFDYLQENPALTRLALWEGLADGESPAGDPPERVVSDRAMIAEVAAAQQRGVVDPAVEPRYLIFLVLALASWWTAAPQTIRTLSAASDRGDDLPGRRAAVVEAAERLGAPGPRGS